MNNNTIYEKSIINVSLSNQEVSKNQYYTTNQRIDNLVNKRKQKQPTKEFYDELDTFVSLQVKSIEVFNRAVTIAMKQGFNEVEIGAFLQDYLKDKIPKTTLWRYPKKIEIVPPELLDFLTNCKRCLGVIELRLISQNRWLPFEYIEGLRHRCERCK